MTLYDIPRTLTAKEIVLASSFPQDYDFGRKKPQFICGMCVPPVMTAQIAHQLYLQWLSKL